jgi:DNA-binding PucR family transcriptional regulator
MTDRSATEQDALLQELVDDFERAAGALAERLRAPGRQVGLSSPPRQPAPDAEREAMLLAECSAVPDAAVAGHEDTYRLLIGVLLRDPSELELLRASTIAPLLAYDAEHETELLVTLETFLAHHGSTTETAEAMGLHRHTVGYRLSRVEEVSGLSPYGSDGRERLSLGLKAAHILDAEKRLAQPG